MTQPTPHGYPDWQPQVPSSDTMFVFESNTATSVNVVRGRFFCGNMRTVGLHFFADTLHFQVALEFYETAVSAPVLGRFVYSVREGSELWETVPVMGAFVKVFITLDAAVAHQFDLALTGHQQHFRGLTTFADPHIIDRSVSVAAGATDTTVATRIWCGPAVVDIRTSLATWQIVVETLDYLGGSQGLANFDNTMSIAMAPIMLPPSNIRVRMINNTAGALGMVCRIVADASWL